jgi:hypothetical protein
MMVLIVPDMFVGTGRYAREMTSALLQAGFGSSSDVQAAFARDGLVFVLLKETTAKMSSGWAPVEPIRPRQRSRPKPGAILTGIRPPRCPACGQPILYDVDDPGKIKAHCQHCRTPMWTATACRPSPALANCGSKEEALLRLIAREKRAGRKVLCFVGQINRRDPTGRLCGLLERYGMRGAVMRANEKQRVQFIRRTLAQGVDVVFTSAPLVMVDIDLLETPTLVWFTAEYNIYVVQQANRRSWRIGQTEDVHVYYLAYDRTPQAYAMHRIAKKLAAAQTLQGDVRQGLAAILGEEDFVSRLQEATIHTEHYESELSIDNLPPLVSFPPAVDVQVTVQTSGPARVRVTVQVEDPRQFQQLNLFG